MFTTDEEKLYLENLLYAIQNIGSGADPALENAKLRLGCLNAAVSIHEASARDAIDAGAELATVEDMIVKTASRFEAYVIGDYKDAALVRFDVPVPMRSTLASESDVAIGTGR
jgi:hypothetical protein